MTRHVDRLADHALPAGRVRKEMFGCSGCAPKSRRFAELTVRDDCWRGRVMDRLRLLAASHGWVIDFDGRAWCPEHRASAAP